MGEPGLEIIRNYDSFDDLPQKLKSNIDLTRAILTLDEALKGLGFPSGTPWFEGLKGKKVVDVGCGSELIERRGHLEGWVPYFSRVCAIKGADVVGIDIKASALGEAELYRHITKDIVEAMETGENLAQTTQFLPGSVDIIHVSLLFDAPNLKPNIGLESWLFNQAQAQLREGGIYQTEMRVYKKSGGVLTHIPR